MGADKSDRYAGGINDVLQEFTGLVLCDYRSERVDVHVRASLVNGELMLSCQDLGPMVEGCWGDEDYEYWYNFTAEETFKLLKAINGLKDPQKALLEKFGGERGCAALRELCEKENIQYSFYSYV